MTILLRWGAGLLLSGMLFCSTQITGGIGHEGEARVAGRVVYTDTDTVPAGAAVYLHSALFTSDTSSTGKTRVPDALVDADGRFAIESVVPGEYVIEVNDGQKSGACIRFAVAKDSPEVNLPDDTLRHSGKIRGKLILDSIGDSPVYLQVYGLDRLAKIDECTDSFIIDDVPAGTYMLHIMSAADLPAPKNIDGVRVQPGGITGISLVYRSVDSLATRVLRVRLNTSATGAATSAAVYDFSVLVRLSADNFDFSQARSDGTDIRFAKNNGTPLPFEIETWDATLQQACIWVRIDTVFGNSATQSFVMRWDGADSLAHAAGAVFDTGCGFLASYHLGGTLDDATLHGYDGIDSGTTDTADGIIGRARAFNGSTQFFSVGDLPDREQGTISCWFRPKTTISAASTTTQGVWGKKESESTNFTLSLGGSDFYIENVDARGRLISKLENPDAGYYLLSATNVFNGNAWYFVSWSWGDGGDSLYVNGTLEASTPHSLKLTGIGAEEIGRSFYDGSNILYGAPNYFNGTLDEFRIDNACRSADWIKLCYMNQRQKDALVEIGDQ